MAMTTSNSNSVKPNRKFLESRPQKIGVPLKYRVESLLDFDSLKVTRMMVEPTLMITLRQFRFAG
jgi:hypothetical protein